MVTEKYGNIFTTSCQTIVNTVNTDGFMGKGIALEMQLRYPEMCDKYRVLCHIREDWFETSQIAPPKMKKEEFSRIIYEELKKKYGQGAKFHIGQLWLYHDEKTDKSILNFPTKAHWKNPTKIEYLEQGLTNFTNTYKDRGIVSIAFPLLGTANGGLTEEKSLSTMKWYLDRIEDIYIEIWHYQKDAYDELFREFRGKLQEIDCGVLQKQMKDGGCGQNPGLEMSQEDVHAYTRAASKGSGAFFVKRTTKGIIANLMWQFCHISYAIIITQPEPGNAYRWSALPLSRMWLQYPRVQ
jgi:O-acetyl-ADP-ribose deacetylase (regulator of RNase III)